MNYYEYIFSADFDEDELISKTGDAAVKAYKAQEFNYLMFDDWNYHVYGISKWIAENFGKIFPKLKANEKDKFHEIWDKHIREAIEQQPKQGQLFDGGYDYTDEQKKKVRTRVKPNAITEFVEWYTQNFYDNVSDYEDEKDWIDGVLGMSFKDIQKRFDVEEAVDDDAFREWNWRYFTDYLQEYGEF